jgi:5-formyltetrahydrofolate cyclo-ligase
VKDAARAEARARLAALTPEERRSAGDAIAERVWQVPRIAAARRLLVYAALPSEVPTEAIAREARRRGIEVVYPRCLPATREMVLHDVAGDDALRAGAYGILEPHEECPVVTAAEIDAALVPGLAWDRRGGRLGRGAGYYDRLLGAPAWRGFLCGLFFSTQELDEIPMERWDVRLDAVVTEDGVRSFELRVES